MSPEELILAIERAFSGIERPETSLRQFVLTDKFGMGGTIPPEAWSKAGKSRADSIWQDLSDIELEECECQLAHMQSHEFLYYLPAYMRYSVRNVGKSVFESPILGGTVFSLYPSSRDAGIYASMVSQLSALTEQQVSVVIEFLKFVAAEASYGQRPDAEKALDRYWYKRVGT